MSLASLASLGALGALVLAGLGACGAPLRCPEHGGRAWRELRSPHFILHTDVSAAEARRFVADLEARFHILAEVVFSSARPIAGRAEVVLFDREEDFREVAPSESVMGYIVPPLPTDAVARPTIVLPAGPGVLGIRLLKDDTLGVLTHEITHWIIRHFMPQVPRWLNEGLAYYCETMDVRDRQITIGRPPSARGANVSFPSALELRAAGPEQFLGGDYETRVGYNLGSWALVHTLASNYGDRLGRYLAALASATPAVDAWELAFAGVDERALLAAYRARLTAAKIPARRLPFTPAAPPAIDELEFGHRKLHLLWSRLLIGDPVRALAQLDELGRESSDGELELRRAVLADARERRDQAIGLARDSVARGGGERALTLLGELLTERRVPLQGKPGDLDLAQVVEKLSSTARTAPALAFLARHRLRLGQLDDAVRDATRATEVDAACWHCHVVLALAYHQRGEAGLAVRSGERALGLVPEYVGGDRVAAIRRAVEAMRQAAPAAEPADGED